LRAAPITSLSRGIHSEVLRDRQTIVSRVPAMTLGFVQKTEDGNVPCSID
jgi:hypothetical protein